MEGEAEEAITPPPHTHTLFGKEKNKKCITCIIAWCYTNVYLTIFWARIHQKYMCSKFRKTRSQKPKLSNFCVCIKVPKFRPPPLKSFCHPCTKWINLHSPTENLFSLKSLEIFFFNRSEDLKKNLWSGMSPNRSPLPSAPLWCRHCGSRGM